jgi:uncharacterized membrane protein YciS (DUF1049 family)
MENQTSKQFALQLGALVTLYTSVIFLILLLFSTVNIIWYDVASFYWERLGEEQTIRLSIASLLVFFPAYLFLTRKVNVSRRESNNAQYVSLTRWLIYLSLLLGGVVILTDFATVIFNFLNGEITTRFLLKSLILLAIIGFTFHYYLRDIKGYWLANEKASLLQAGIAIVVILSSIVFGYSKISGPEVVRALKIDEKQLSDLQLIQNKIELYVQTNNKLPNSLEELYAGMDIPSTEGRPDYTYSVFDQKFSLCANFAYDANNQNTTTHYIGEVKIESLPGEEYKITNYHNWDYKAGNFCFERELKNIDG